MHGRKALNVDDAQALPLAILLLRRMIAAAAGMTLLLIAGVGAADLADTDKLHSLVAEMLANHADATSSEDRLWRAHPAAYGWRLLDRNDGEDPHLIASINGDLFPPAANRPVVGAMAATVGGASVAIYSRHIREAGARRWLQVAVAADPAHLTWRVLAVEVFDHVVLPALLIVPAITLVIWVAVRRVLAPLAGVAAAAVALREGAAMQLQPLPEAGLPREVAELVRALNTMLVRLETALASRVTALLRLAEAEEGAAGPVSCFDFAAVARQVCIEMAPLAAASGRRLEFAGPYAPVMTTGQAALAEIAVRNLIDNGLRATPEGGAVAVRIGEDGTLLVSDQGAGVPEADRERIFRRFQRGPGGGAGIGLSLVRRIATLYGGEVHVEPAQGGGARFALRLAPGRRV